MIAIPILLSVLACVNAGNKPAGSPLLIGRHRCKTYLLHDVTFTFQSSDDSSYEVRASRHHIIPYATLKRFFNTVMLRSASRPSDYLTFTEVLQTLITKARRNVCEQGGITEGDNFQPITSHNLIVASRFVERIRKDRININTDTVNFSDVDKEAITVIQTLFVWMPGNIFIGPTSVPVGNRLDDPEDLFEIDAKAFIGQSRYDNLVILNDLMLAYNEKKYNSQTSRLKDGTEVTMNRIKNLLENMGDTMTVTSSKQWFKFPGDRVTRVTIPWADDDEFITDVSIKNIGSVPVQTCGIIKPIRPPYVAGPNDNLLVQSDVEKLNVGISANVFKRAIDGDNFKKQEHVKSWKEWYNKYARPSSSLDVHSILRDGRQMAGTDNSIKPYGVEFEDGSLAVGVLGSDTENGSDNWKREKNWSREDAGQMYFDKKGKPVAIVMVTGIAAKFPSVWYFVYKDGAWVRERDHNWHNNRFKTTTESLDPHAPRFFIYKT